MKSFLRNKYGSVKTQAEAIGSQCLRQASASHKAIKESKIWEKYRFNEKEWFAWQDRVEASWKKHKKKNNQRFEERVNQKHTRFVNQKKQFQEPFRTLYAKARDEVVDPFAMGLWGCGVGILVSGCNGSLLVGGFLTSWGAVRTARRWVVDSFRKDADKLFRGPAWLPREWRETRRMILQRVLLEDGAFTSTWESPRHNIYNQNLHKEQEERKRGEEWHPSTFYKYTMDLLQEHPQSLMALGTMTAKPPAEVLRKFSPELSCVYMEWEVQGANDNAKVFIQTLDTVVDYIYVYPENSTSFVIRPHGNTWSHFSGQHERFCDFQVGRYY